MRESATKRKLSELTTAERDRSANNDDRSSAAISRKRLLKNVRTVTGTLNKTRENDQSFPAGVVIGSTGQGDNESFALHPHKCHPEIT